MRVVLALGGNALLRRGQPPTLELQQANVARAAREIASLGAEHQLIITHGNGPQIGLLALQAEASAEVPPYPLDVLGAESEGLIGYLIQQALCSALADREILACLTQIEVDRDDPAFARPSKPIGPVMPAAAARELAEERGWSLAPDGDGLRRVVPSPEPRRIIELPTLRRLVDQGVLVVCAGGGGIPVRRRDDGALEGIEAVVDKDLAAALLATELAAELLVLLTDVPAVYAGWPSRSEPIEQATPAQLRERAFEAGSMGPKVEAACRFAERGGRAVIGALDDAAALVRGECGTRIEPANVLEPAR
jgi:carbamate kinase